MSSFYGIFKCLRRADVLVDRRVCRKAAEKRKRELQAGCPSTLFYVLRVDRKPTVCGPARSGKGE